MKTRFLTIAALLAAASLHASTTIDATNSFAYGANIGWVGWRGDVTNGAVIGEHVCSGNIWSANCGWISLGSGAPANGIQYGNASAGDFGVNLTGHYISGGIPRAQLRGFAYGANIGWINFEALGNPEVSLSTGRLSGFAYSANCGWIALGDALGFVETDSIRPSTDSDGDGIADAYEYTHTDPPSLAVLTGTGDADGDGMSDVDEYLADTDPLNPLDALRITNFVRAPDGLQVTLTWTSQPTRSYRLMNNGDLATSWVLGMDNITPDAGATTTRVLPTNPVDLRRFFRVAVFRPLAP